MFVDRYLYTTRVQHSDSFVRVICFRFVGRMELFREKQRFVLYVGATAASLALLWDYLQRRTKRCNEREVHEQL